MSGFEAVTYLLCLRNSENSVTGVSDVENNRWGQGGNMVPDHEDLVDHVKGLNLFSEWDEKPLECLSWGAIRSNLFFSSFIKI